MDWPNRDNGCIDSNRGMGEEKEGEMNQYEPEMGQSVFGCDRGDYETPEYVDTFLEHILNEIDRVYWNIHQREWDRADDPAIPGVDYQPYYWGECTCGFDEADGEWHTAWESEHGMAVYCDCGYDELYAQEYGKWRETHNHAPDCPIVLPNFKFGDVSISWYKHPGRGQSCNVKWDERQWRIWFDECMKAIARWEQLKGG